MRGSRAGKNLLAGWTPFLDALDSLSGGDGVYFSLSNALPSPRVGHLEQWYFVVPSVDTVFACSTSIVQNLGVVGAKPTLAWPELPTTEWQPSSRPSGRNCLDTPKFFSFRTSVGMVLKSFHVGDNATGGCLRNPKKQKNQGTEGMHKKWLRVQL